MSYLKLTYQLRYSVRFFSFELVCTMKKTSHLYRSKSCNLSCDPCRENMSSHLYRSGNCSFLRAFCN
ncbi:unnamed protein product [Rodentolepis nana]|uniref:Ovule protein n=1 Tax=Rodentolepis nana TaxID=102285 RepID=A0A0R3TNI2_RODNA|nr:unnamed protein product [Rodentolepis nana]